MNRYTVLITAAVISSLVFSCAEPHSPAPAITPVITGEPSPTDTGLLTSPALSEQTEFPKRIARAVSQEKFKLMQADNKMTVLDVRTPEEFEEGHIDGAVNADAFGPELINQLEGLDRNQPYVLYCVSGKRSNDVMDLMVDLGFVEVYNLEGGYPGFMGVLR